MSTADFVTCLMMAIGGVTTVVFAWGLTWMFMNPIDRKPQAPATAPGAPPMSDTAIPDSVMQKARAIAFEIAPYEADDEKCAFRTAKWKIIALAILAAKQEERERAWKHGYAIGFGSSAEGWNGEYPFQDGDIALDSDPKWVECRDLAFGHATAIRAKGQ